MQVSEWLPYVTALSVVGSGLFALLKWADQRNRELIEQRFEQYWKILENAVETKFISKQKVALLLLKRYPEYESETATFLRDAKRRGGPWTDQNVMEIDEVLGHFAGKR